MCWILLHNLLGDRQQLGPLLKSKDDNVNEFVEQGGCSLFARLLLHEFPSTQLQSQYRMYLEIYAMVNERVNQNRLRNNATTKSRPRDTTLDAFIRANDMSGITYGNIFTWLLGAHAFITLSSLPPIWSLLNLSAINLSRVTPRTATFFRFIPAATTSG